MALHLSFCFILSSLSSDRDDSVLSGQNISPVALVGSCTFSDMNRVAILAL